jgi:uncharacterized membrane protein
MELTEFLSLLSVLGLIVVGALSLRLRRIRKAIEALSERVASLEKKIGETAARPAVAEKVPIPPSPLLATPPPIPASLKGAPPHVAPSIPSSPTPGAPSFNWEAFMGVKLFAWLGGFALFLGIVFLVKYSFENNLITPLGRIVIGATVAIALVGSGWWLSRGRYRATAQSLCATGLVILYADLFAAHSFYGLISLTTALFAMAAVTLSSFLLAVALQAQVIVILGLLGGFLTPVLLPSGLDNAPALFLYIALLDLGVAAVALRSRWLYLLLLAAIGTSLTQLRWADEFFGAAKGARAFWIFLGFEALFLGFFLSRFAIRSPATESGASLERNNPATTSDSQSEATTAKAEKEKTDRPGFWATAAAAIAGFTALGFGFWICAFPLLARRPFYFFGFVFLAEAGLLALPVLARAYRLIGLAAGALTFALVATWIGLFAPKAPLSASLAAIVIFTLLHAATAPAAAWRPKLLPFTAGGTTAPFILLIILCERLELSDPTPVFAIAFVLAAILLAAAIVKRADWLSGSALLGIAMLELVWQGDRFEVSQATPVLIWYGLFLILFVAYPFFSAQKEKAWSWAVSALAQGLQFWLIYRAITLAFPNDRMGLLPAAFILPAGLGVFALLKFYQAVPATGDVRLAWQGGALLLFVSLIFPLQFDREWVTLGWALEGLALLALFHRLPHRGLRLVGVALLTAAFIRLALNPAVFEYHKRTGVRIWNWYLYAYGITTFCLLAGAAIFGKKENFLERSAPPFLASMGTILAFILLNLEIADYFSIGPTLTFSFSGNFARDMTYSIAWALFALVLIVLGMRIKQRAARYAGVALLGITLAKLFLHDLSDLNELYRIGAFVGVAIILIAASFIYQRFLAPERP